MIIDFHVHIFPPDIRKDRQPYFSGEPEFKLLYDHPKARLCGAKELIVDLDQQGVDKAVVFGFPWKNPATLKKHNDYIAAAMARYPGRLIGFGCLDPSDPGAAAEAERCLAGPFAGIGELAFYRSGFDEAAVEHLAPVMDLCRNAAAPVLIHANEPIGHAYPGKVPMTYPQIYRLIRKFPENRIVLAHWGGGIFFFQLARKEIKEAFKNIYFDTAASPFLYDSRVYGIAVRIVGPKKIVFGSDYPLIKPQKYFEEIRAAGLVSDEMQLILGGNAAKLLGMSNDE